MQNQLEKADHSQICCSYAALLLHDSGISVTVEKLSAVLKSTGNDEVDEHIPKLFVKELENKNLRKILEDCAAVGLWVNDAHV